MGNYYCLVAGLPDIDLADTQPGFSFEELRTANSSSTSI